MTCINYWDGEWVYRGERASLLSFGACDAIQVVFLHGIHFRVSSWHCSITLPASGVLSIFLSKLLQLELHLFLSVTHVELNSLVCDSGICILHVWSQTRCAYRDTNRSTCWLQIPAITLSFWVACISWLRYQHTSMLAGMHAYRMKYYRVTWDFCKIPRATFVIFKWNNSNSVNGLCSYSPLNHLYPTSTSSSHETAGRVTCHLRHLMACRRAMTMFLCPPDVLNEIYGRPTWDFQEAESLSMTRTCTFVV